MRKNFKNLGILLDFVKIYVAMFMNLNYPETVLGCEDGEMS